MNSATCLLLLAGLAAPAAGAETKFASHPPMRPLPLPSIRPVEPGDPAQARYVDPLKGDDASDGSIAKPWKSLQRSAARLKPGQTLCLRGGIYREHATLTCEGKAEAPITIRAFPAEMVVIDGGLPQFQDEPDKAWEPCPGGVEGEFRSTKTYPDLGGAPGDTNVLGRFVDSLTPLHGYRFLSDLRSKNEKWNLAIKTGEDAAGIWCGPGVFYDPATARIHVRLAHTNLPGLGDDNYRGETDPRKIPLIVAGFAGGSPLMLRRARHVRLLDLVVLGARTAAVDIDDCTDIECVGLSMYGGASAMRVIDTRGLRVFDCALRGIAAPWTFRGSLKYRAIESRIFTGGSWSPTGADNADFELAYSEFTDSVDGVFIGNVNNVSFHHNLLDNVSDDGIFLTAGTAFDGSTHGGGHRIYQNLLSRCLTTFAFGVGHGRQKTLPVGKQTGAGAVICRNVFDFRRPVSYHIPGDAEDASSYGRMAGDHGSPTWEPMTLHHNTILAFDAPWRGFYLSSLGGGMQKGTARRLFNNIVLHAQGKPGTVMPAAELNFQADGNLHWSLAEGAALADSFLKGLHASKSIPGSKTAYPPGWTASDRFADPKFAQVSGDWKAALDLSLSAGSPAIDAGVALPADGFDPVRALDSGKPDLGALPAGAAPWRVGVRGRLDMFGRPQTPTDTAVPAPTWKPHDDWANARVAKPAAVVQGYPAFDSPLAQFALRRQRVEPEVFAGKWLDTKDYAKYGTVVIVGDLKRAKTDPNTYSADDLPRVRAFLEAGGTLLLMRGCASVFATSEGREFLDSLVGAGSTKVDPAKTDVLLPAHPWLAHLDRTAKPSWLAGRNAVALGMGKGDCVVGQASGATLVGGVAVGKGRLIYMGYEIAATMPEGRRPSTPEQERAFEELAGVLMRMLARP